MSDKHTYLKKKGGVFLRSTFIDPCIMTCLRGWSYESYATKLLDEVMQNENYSLDIQSKSDETQRKKKENQKNAFELLLLLLAFHFLDRSNPL